MQQEQVLQALRECVGVLKAKGKTNDEIASALGCTYETMRRTLKGEVKSVPLSFALTLHELTGRSMDQSFGLGPKDDLESKLREAQKKVSRLEFERELLVDVLYVMKGQSLAGESKGLEPRQWSGFDKLPDEAMELLSALNKKKT